MNGKITIVNTLIIPSMIYPSTILKFPLEYLNEINCLIQNFIWGNDKHKIAKHIIEQKVNTSELNMPNVVGKVKA